MVSLLLNINRLKEKCLKHISNVPLLQEKTVHFLNLLDFTTGENFSVDVSNIFCLYILFLLVFCNCYFLLIFLLAVSFKMYLFCVW